MVLLLRLKSYVPIWILKNGVTSLKKIAVVFAAIIVLAGLTDCSPQKKESVSDQEKAHVTKPKEVSELKTKEERQKATKKENQQYSKTEKGSTANESLSKTSPKKIYRNAVFKEVMVTEDNDKMMVTGKAQVFEGVFRYALYKGDQVILQGRYQTVGAPAWGNFNISFPKSRVAAGQAKFELFVYSAKDGAKVNVLDIPLQTK